MPTARPSQQHDVRIEALEPRQLLTAAVLDEYVFYENSAFDGYAVGAGNSDDAAIAPDKRGLRPGETADFSHYTSYSHGLNGVMIDILNLPGAALTAGDFTFRVGNNSAFGNWAAAPNPVSITVRAGQGASGSDRVTLIWPDGAIKGQWLQVSVLPTAATGLVAAHTFYFGNAIGETGNTPADALVTAADEVLARSNGRSPTNPAPITFAYDFNRDKLVNSQDQLITRSNRTSPLNGLKLIAVPDVIYTPLHERPDALAAEAALLAIRKTDTPDAIYSAFNEFARTHFGALADALIYDKFGSELNLVDSGAWRHVSENSASIAWETNLPALTWVEYGLSAAYGQRTAITDRPYSLHMHQLTGLATGQTYHYRLIAIDERGELLIAPDQTLTTAPVAGAVYLYNKADGSMQTLDQTGTTYVLKQHIVATGTALRTVRDNITIDLNGYTITYAQGGTSSAEAHGIWAYGSHLTSLSQIPYQATNLKIFNGTIRQGTSSYVLANTSSYGFNTMKLSGQDIEFAGLNLIYHAPQSWGVQMNHSLGQIHVHHNTIRDMGATITDRNGSAARSIGFRLPRVSPNEFVINNNLIQRARQNALSQAHSIYKNEIYVDSWSTNSFAIQPESAVGVDAGEHHGNRIFATGFNPYGFGWAHENLLVRDNFIHMFGLNTTYRWHETWGDVNMLAAMRVTNYGSGGQVRNHLQYTDNLILLRGKQGSQLEGTRFFSDNTITGLVFSNNTVKVEALDAQTTLAAAIVVQGHFRKEDSLPVFYRDSRLISNTTLVQFGDAYGKGNNHQFERVTFEKLGNNPNFRTFVFSGTYWSYNHAITDGIFLGGAAVTDVYWDQTATISSYAIKWTLSLQTTAGALVTIRNNAGQIEFQGVAGADGKVTAVLTQGIVRPADWIPTHSTTQTAAVKLHDQHQMIAATPHKVEVSLGLSVASAVVVMSEPQSLALTPTAPTAYSIAGAPTRAGRR